MEKKVSWKYSSLSPDTNFKELVKDVVSSLHVDHQIVKSGIAGDCTYKGDIENTLKEVWRILEEDYLQNLNEDDKQYSFQYIITTDGFGQYGAGIFTRLYSPDQEEKGDIFYGPLIIREDTNVFSIWM